MGSSESKHTSNSGSEIDDSAKSSSQRKVDDVSSEQLMSQNAKLFSSSAKGAVNDPLMSVID